jgi:hypothetical protein
MNTGLKTLRSTLALAMTAASVGFAGCSGSHDMLPSAAAAAPQLVSSSRSMKPGTVNLAPYKMMAPLVASINRAHQLVLSALGAPGPRLNPCPGVATNAGRPIVEATNLVVQLSTYTVVNFGCNASTAGGTPTRYAIVMITNPSSSVTDPAATSVTFSGIQSQRTITFAPMESSITLAANVNTSFFIAYK